MRNIMSMANITPIEIAVVAAAILLIFVAPALVAWGDARRRAALRAREWAAAGVQPLPAVAALSGDQPPVGFAAAPDVVWDAGAPGQLLPTVEAATAERVQSPIPAPAPPLVLHPLEGPARFQCRLQDLRQVRLPDWPPATVRDDPDRSRRWHEAEERAEPQRAVIVGATIWSPYPPRSSCLGSAEVEGDTCYLRFLLFPVVWPLSQNQAVAQAVFALGRSGGEIRGWVDALRPQELTEENRREIVEGGGEI